MPCISGLLNNKSQALVNVSVAPLKTGNVEKQEIHGFLALMDTGANRTCINRDVIQKLSLLPVGKVNMSSASHNVIANSYMLDLIFPFGAIHMMQSGVTVLEFNGSNDFQVLIGMDIISRGVFNLSFDRRFVFCL